MSVDNDDLTGAPLNASQLAIELRSARARNEELLRAHRQSTSALQRIAVAAGLQDLESVSDLVNGVIAQLNSVTLAAPPVEPVITTGLTCEACGDDGATDMGDAVLCRACSGEDALTEAGRL